MTDEINAEIAARLVAQTEAWTGPSPSAGAALFAGTEVRGALTEALDSWRGPSPWAGQARFARPAPGPWRRLASSGRGWAAAGAVGATLVAGGVVAAAHDGFTIPMTHIHLGNPAPVQAPVAPALPAELTHTESAHPRVSGVPGSPGGERGGVGDRKATPRPEASGAGGSKESGEGASHASSEQPSGGSPSHQKKEVEPAPTGEAQPSPEDSSKPSDH
ncbi:MAG: hypothetical protein ACYDGR_02605 [Candidatus Dormibacteria bacterium]